MIRPIGGRNPITRAWRQWKRYGASIIFGNTMLSHDFREFIKSLNDNQVRYLVVGGYAVAIHGHPRYTKDIDIWLELSPENAKQIIEALAQFGFGSSGLREEDFLDASQVVQLGYPPNRIDLILSLQGVDFETCYQDRLQVSVDEVAVNFIDVRNLKKNKRAVGRLQDLADVENLETSGDEIPS